MDDTHVVWDLEDDPDGTVQHIQEHGISMDEVEDVLLDRDSQTAVSKSSGDPIFPISRRALAPVCVIRTGASALRLIAACFTSSGSYCDPVPDEVPEPGRRTPQRRKK